MGESFRSGGVCGSLEEPRSPSPNREFYLHIYIVQLTVLESRCSNLKVVLCEVIRVLLLMVFVL